MGSRFTRIAFLFITVVAVGAAAFRVATGPERAKERRETARSVCAQSGGEWIRVENDEICRRDDGVAKGV